MNVYSKQKVQKWIKFARNKSFYLNLKCLYCTSVGFGVNILVNIHRVSFLEQFILILVIYEIDDLEYFINTMRWLLDFWIIFDCILYPKIA